MVLRWQNSGPAAPILAAVVLALGLYALTLAGTRIYDDRIVAQPERDPRLRDVAQWPQYLTQGYVVNSVDHLWRPLASLSLAVQVRFMGDRLWAMHLLNILLHAGVSALVAALAWRLAGLRVAWIAGLLFAAHPLHVEAVAYLVGRCETLCALGILGAVFLFVADRPLTLRRVFAIYACLWVALLSKEQGLLLPLILLVWWVGRETASDNQYPPVIACGFALPIPDPPTQRRTKTSPHLWLVILFLWTMAAYIIYRQQILPWTWDTKMLDWVDNPLVRSGRPDRWLIPISLLGRYAGLLVFPWRLSPDYSASVFLPAWHENDPYFYAGIVALLGYAAALGTALVRRSRAALFCLIALGLTYFLIANVILIGTIFGERLMYVPSAFAAILLALAARRLPKRWLIAAMTLVLILFSLRTLTYAARWNDRRGFYEKSWADQPNSAPLGILLAMECREQCDYEHSAEILALTRQRTPDYWKTWFLSATIAQQRGRLDEALQYILQAKRLAPEIPVISQLEADIRQKMKRPSSVPSTQN